MGAHGYGLQDRRAIVWDLSHQVGLTRPRSLLPMPHCSKMRMEVVDQKAWPIQRACSGLSTARRVVQCLGVIHSYVLDARYLRGLTVGHGEVSVPAQADGAGQGKVVAVCVLCLFVC